MKRETPNLYLMAWYQGGMAHQIVGEKISVYVLTEFLCANEDKTLHDITVMSLHTGDFVSEEDIIDALH